MLHALNNVDNRTDIFTVLETIRTVEIMKYLVFNKTQRNLIEFIHRDQICYNEKNDELSFQCKYREYNLTEEEKSKLLLKFLEEGKKGALETDIDLKLYNSIDEVLR